MVVLAHVLACAGHCRQHTLDSTGVLHPVLAAAWHDRSRSKRPDGYVPGIHRYLTVIIFGAQCRTAGHCHCIHAYPTYLDF